MMVQFLEPDYFLIATHAKRCTSNDTLLGRLRRSKIDSVLLLTFPFFFLTLLFWQATAIKGAESSLITDYTLKVSWKFKFSRPYWRAFSVHNNTSRATWILLYKFSWSVSWTWNSTHHLTHLTAGARCSPLLIISDEHSVRSWTVIWLVSVNRLPMWLSCDRISASA